MNEYEKMCAYFKIMYANIFSLHHNLIGGNWHSDHKQLGKYYEMIGIYLDELIECGLSLGYKEPSISDAVLTFSNEVLPCMNREKGESFGYILEAFRSAAGMLKAAEAVVPPDVQNKLQEIEYELNLEADYKIVRLLNATAPTAPTYDYDDDD